MCWRRTFLTEPKRRAARRDPEHGAIAILMALCLTFLLGFAAMGFDLAYVREARQELRNSIDAAAHAAANTLRITDSTGSAVTAGRLIAGQNTILGKPLTLADSDFTFGGWNFFTNTFSSGGSPPNAVQVNALSLTADTAGGYINLTFGRGLGFTESDITSAARTAFRRRNIMLEMDVTGSFALISNSVNSTNIDNAVQADLAFLDTLDGFHFATDSLGMDTFTGNAAASPSGLVNWTPLQSLGSNYTSIRLLWAGDGKRSDNTTKSSGIAVCKKTGVDASWPNHNYALVQSCWDGGETGFFAGTNIGSAIKAGTDKLIAKTLTSPWETRVLVVLTDGGPMCCETKGGGGLDTSWALASGGTGRCGDGAPHDSALGDYMPNYCSDSTGVCLCARGLAADGVTQANYAAANHVILYTIAFGNYAPRLRYAASLVRNGGTAETTADSTELANILKTIAGKIPVSMTN
jgi:Flp pilus assembly protein TadG